MNYDNIINKNKPMTYKLQTKDNVIQRNYNTGCKV